jgi:hypothetical protein
MATRRAFLAGLAATLAPRPTWAEVGSPAFLAAARAGQDYVLHGLTETGDSLFSLPCPPAATPPPPTRPGPRPWPLPAAPAPSRWSSTALRGTTAARLTPPEGRQFNGHGVFAGDGALLMTSEVAAETSDGLLGLWETATWARIGEWPTGGIGPHDLSRLPDGRLVVANGGIRTDPTDRRKLNLDTMRPNLTLLAADGEILDQAALPEALHRNSIRHLARQGDAIAFAMQWEGDAAEPVPQLGLWTPGSAPMLCPPDDTQAFAMKGYAGSIATAPGLVALTSAPGGALMLFDAAGAPLATHRRADVSGVALGPRGLVATDGQGGIWAVDGQRLQLLAHHPVAWDNHLVSLA